MNRQECCGLKFNPLQHDLLASGGNDNKLFVWDIRHLSRDRSGQSHPLHKFNEHTAAIKALAWSPHASGILASGGGTLDRRLRFWNTGTGKKINEFDTGSQVGSPGKCAHSGLCY
jgi:cell division cycle 20-like protein 1 (cofactor of APC complex)